MRMRLRPLAFVILLLAAGSSASAQQTGARASDVESIDAILAAVYASISGPAGPRDWERFHSLFIPDARLIPTGRPPQGAARHQVWSPQQYVERVGPMFEQNPFHEIEVHRVVEEFGNIAHVFSTYESRRDPADAEPFQRGINSIQLFNDGTRWWVVTIFWDAERDGNPIPAKYLPR